MTSSVINATVNGINATGGNTAELALQVGGTAAITVNSAGYSILANPLPVESGGTGSNTGAFSGANLTSINASAISSGTLDNARTTASSSNGANTIVLRDAAGDFSADVITANDFSGSGANLTSLNASSVSSGTLAVANGGTGAATLDANNVILGNGTSAVQFVAPGTNGNVLTSNGSTWASTAPAGGGGSFVYLASATAASNVVDFTGLDTTTYFSFLITFTDVRAGAFTCRLYPGGTLATTNYANAFVSADSSGVGGSGGSGNTFITIAPSNVTTANVGCTGYLHFFPAGGYSVVYSNFLYIANTSVVSTIYSQSGTVGNANAANGIRFGGSNMGNLTGGNFRLYGIKNS
jgi:hypothetical protein